MLRGRRAKLVAALMALALLGSACSSRDDDDDGHHRRRRRGRNRRVEHRHRRLRQRPERRDRGRHDQARVELPAVGPDRGVRRDRPRLEGVLRQGQRRRRCRDRRHHLPDRVRGPGRPVQRGRDRGQHRRDGGPGGRRRLRGVQRAWAPPTTSPSATRSTSCACPTCSQPPGRRPGATPTTRG